MLIVLPAVRGSPPPEILVDCTRLLLKNHVGYSLLVSQFVYITPLQRHFSKDLGSCSGQTHPELRSLLLGRMGGWSDDVMIETGGIPYGVLEDGGAMSGTQREPGYEVLGEVLGRGGLCYECYVINVVL